MKTRFGFVCLMVACLITVAATAQIADRDTTLVLGGPDRWDGRFENAAGEPDWHGWTHVDMYGGNQEIAWHVSDFRPVAGQYSLWCGTWFDNDCADGYGNNWNQSVVFTHAVNDPTVASFVRLQATVDLDSEADYDYLHVQWRDGLQWRDLVDQPYDGTHVFAVDDTVTIPPTAYLDGNLHLRFLAQSDGAWSDEDCLWDTHGFVRLDDITVTVDEVVVSVEDFESGESQDWLSLALPVIGDFTGLWYDLDDIDPEHQNDSWQVAFIDDGIVVPGTGGTACQSWCYGPDGWVYNVTAGLDGNGVPGGPLGGSTGGVWNAVVSPALSWPEAADTGEFAFDVYAHMQYYECGLTMYGATMRATAGTDPTDLEATEWLPTQWSYFNESIMPMGPGYFRVVLPLDTALVPDTRWVQVRFEAFEGGPWCWGDYVWDSTPAPYLDNVAVRAWRTTTDVAPEAPALALSAAPNPFNPRVQLHWSQPSAGPVELTVFDARGRLVRSLLDAAQPAGAGIATWNGRDESGRSVAAGLYLVRLRTTAGVEVCKLSLVR